MNAVFDPETQDAIRLTTDEMLDIIRENASEVGADTANIFGFDNDTLARVGGHNAGFSGHAEDGLQLTQEELERRERERQGAQAFVEAIDPLIAQQLLELTQQVDEQISFVQQELVVNGQQIAVTQQGITDTGVSLDAAREATRMDAMRLFREADALSEATREADLAGETVEAVGVDLDNGHQVSHIELWAQHQAAEAAARVEALTLTTEELKETHGESLERQVEIEAQLEALEVRLVELEDQRAGLNEQSADLQAFRERISDPEFQAGLDQEGMDRLNAEFESIRNGTPAEPAIGMVEISPEAPEADGAVAEVEAVELTQAAVQTDLANGELRTGQLAAEGVAADIAAQLEGHDLGDNSSITGTRDGVVEVSQQIDTAVVTAERTGTSAAPSEIIAVPVNSAFKSAVAPAENIQTADYTPQTPAPGMSPTPTGM